MMKTQFKITTLLFAMNLCVVPQVTSADLNMRNLFDSYSSGSAGSYNTSQGRYYTLGGFQARFKKNTGANLLEVSPPSLKYGCGGIDFFAGSFGMISGDELVQVARGAAQGAAYYFFDIAIKSICSTCSATMNTLMEKIEEMNKFARNTCESTFALKSDKMGNSENVAQKITKSQGGLLDSLDGFTNSWLNATEAAPEDKTSDQNKKATSDTNVVHLVLKSSFDTITLPTLGLSNDDARNFFMSIFGTKISAVLTGQACTDAEAAGKSCLSFTPVEPSLSLNTLVYGPSPNSTDKIIECADLTNDPDCTTLTPKNLPDSFKGLQYYYQTMLDGDGTTDGIMSAYRKGVNGTLSQAQKNFINAHKINFPYITSKTPKEQQTEIAIIFSYHLTQIHLKALLDDLKRLIKVANSTGTGTQKIYSEKDIVRLIENFEENKNRIEKDLSEKAQKSLSLASMMQTLIQLNKDS